MRQYWIENATAPQFSIDGEMFHHIFGVCRQSVGDQFEVIVGNGKSFLVEVIDKQKKQAAVKVISEKQIAPLPRPWLRLALCNPRPPILESVVEKCVELGVYEIQLLCSERSFFRQPKDFPANRIERLNKIIRSATQQSGRGECMKLAEPMQMTNWLEKMNPCEQAACLFLFEGDADLTIKKALREKNFSAADQVTLLVGGEGGFTENETDLLRKHGCAPVTMGQQVLRVETACLTGMSILKYELDLM